VSNSFNTAKHPSGVTIYSLTGQLLLVETANQLVEKVEQDLERNQRLFIMDLKGLDHVNSSGLNSLLRTFTKIRNKGGESVIINPSPSVKKLLEISKLNTVFRIETSEESAIQHLTAHEA
jgi:anti-anti-sigma factor